ncbi:Lhr family helicase [Luteimicrobium subarcticum]|uniref:Lhr family ATP dependent helicase n=1 Tax=Luteimicrobium subarcticum TaxID=620910 RepID=A0A2M8WTW0_9MICO|nr:DEAD/DEAH box helicase [Luteimicrobium subarcticum]PJI94382.1 Lhr family ATP dependent helicase [Luteimicrobium subarcticum]
MAAPDPNPLAGFGAPTRDWFAGAFEAPTAAQAGAWEAVGSGRHALVVAPTGSGKTLAAFLWSIDRLVRPDAEPAVPAERCRVLYVSPLKALAADVERNLRSPLTGIRQAAARRNEPVRDVEVGLRTGDTPARERRAFPTAPPDVLVTTPESLFLVLTSGARAGLAGVQTVIVDEIHALAGTKRGAHLAVSLERLDAMLPAPAQRIGLSATVRPVDAVARFLGGARTVPDGGREVVVVQPPSRKELRIDVEVPVPDLSDLAATPARDRGAPGRGAEDGLPPLPPGEPDLTGAAAMPLPGDPGVPAVGGAPGAGAATDGAARPGNRSSVWPHVEERIVDLVAQDTGAAPGAGGRVNRSTLVFTNSRRGAERLTARLNELWAERQGEEVLDPGTVRAAQVQAQSGASAGVEPVVARAHHGSMSRAERTRTETELKEGRLPAVVATSSLELGIDMGAIDLVVQVGSPPSVASGLQRLGRAGHQVGAVSHGVVLPTFRGDLVPSTVIARRMRAGEIEAVHVLRNPLDVLAQQVVAMVAHDTWAVDDLATVVRRAAPFEGLTDGALTAVLDMLAGRYPSEDFGELRARVVWDRAAGTLAGRPGAARLAVTSGGTIPDRGLYGVFLVGADDATVDGTASAGGDADAGVARGRQARRVGELDEEMVYESRVGDTFTLGSSTWRIEEITPDRVLVSPAPGLPGRLPFWKGDSPGRPAELGRAVGAWVRETSAAATADPSAAHATLRADGLDDWAADNLLAYLAEQRAATGSVPDDRTVVVERFRDELGDWRVVVHSPYGARVHAPWALVVARRLRERLGVDVSALHSDDGIVLRVPDAEDVLGGWDDASGPDAPGAAGGVGTGGVGLDDLLIEPDEVVEQVRDALGGSVLFGARFREAAARALLLPRRRPDRRQPLWQQRQRSAQLLAVASQFPQFPIVLEAARECLQDDFDTAALTTLMDEVRSRRVRVVEVTTPSPSPFAQSLLFGYTAQFLYDGDAPLAERRAAALVLDPTLLSELLGAEGAGDLADLLDPDQVVRTEDELQHLAPDRRAKDAEALWDVLRRVGPLPGREVVRRVRDESADDVPRWLAGLEAARRVVRVRVAGAPADDVEQWAVAEDAGRLRDALGVALPVGLPEALLEPVPDALGDLVRRHARTHGPFPAADVAHRFGLGRAVVADVVARLVASGVLVRGRLRPPALGGTGDEVCDAEVLRRLRRRSLAALRAEVEPVPPETLGVFLPQWQNVTDGSSHGAPPLSGADGLLRVVEQLSGAAVPASALESLVLPSRVRGYTPALLDELTTSGEVLWCGHAAIAGSGGGDGLVSLHLADTAHLTLPDVPALDDVGAGTDLHRAVLDVLDRSGGVFVGRLAELVEASPVAVLESLWDLVWAGRVTNDGLAALRSRLGTAGGAHRAPRAPARARPMTRRAGFGLGVGRTARDDLRGGTGRWAALPGREPDATRRTHALTSVLLDRYGVLTRGVAAAEDVTGYFRGVYRVLAEEESLGRVRRGYFVEHLGGSQFALPGAVDVLRAHAQDLELARQSDTGPGGAGSGGAEARGAGRAMLLAATDPANPYGAALAWPVAAPPVAGTRARPGRKAGAVVLLCAGELVAYVERGGRSVLTFTPDERALRAAADRLVGAVRAGTLGRLTVQRVDGAPTLDGVQGGRGTTPATRALLAAGFTVAPSGLRVAPGTTPTGTTPTGTTRPGAR